MNEREQLSLRVRRLIVETLKLKVLPESIDAAQPLFGEGLGLDSVDALELVLALEHAFGVQVTEEIGRKILGSVDGIVDYLVEQDVAA
jgi:acyl carrier protein